MITRVLALIFAVAIAGVSAPATADEEYWLKDESVLTVGDDGTITLVDKDGAEIAVAEGKEMELADGGVITVKNGAVVKGAGSAGE
jgi:hypothetical protein